MKRLLLLLLVLSAQGAVAEVYKWVDETGQVHYGDRPRGNRDTETLEMDLQTVDTDIDEERNDKRDKLLEVMQEDRLEKQRLREEQQAERASRMKECKRLKKNHERFRHAGGVYRKDKDGERQYYSKDQRSETEAAFRKRIKQVCN